MIWVMPLNANAAPDLFYGLLVFVDKITPTEINDHFEGIIFS